MDWMLTFYPFIIIINLLFPSTIQTKKNIFIFSYFVKHILGKKSCSASKDNWEEVGQNRTFRARLQCIGRRLEKRYPLGHASNAQGEGWRKGIF